MRQLRLREIKYLVQGHPAWKAQGWSLKAPEARPLITTQQLPFGAAEPASCLQRRSLTFSVSAMPSALIFSNQPLRTAVYYTGESCAPLPSVYFWKSFSSPRPLVSTLQIQHNNIMLPLWPILRYFLPSAGWLLLWLIYVHLDSAFVI